MTKTKYGFENIEVGASAEFEFKEGIKGARNKIAASVSIWGKKNGRKFTTKGLPENKIQVTRVA